MENLAIRLKNARKKSGLSLVAAAKIADVSDKTYAKWEEGETSPDVERLEKLAEAFGENLFFLLTGTQPITIAEGREIPIVDHIPAGPLTQAFGEEGILGYVRADIDDPEAFGLVVQGVSMWPEIVENDIVFCSPRAPFINGRIYAVVIGEGEQSLKRVRHDKRKEAYVLQPSNKEFPTLYIPEKHVLKLVRVVGVRRDLL